ncbi:MAG TPA: FAD-dependent oxidoreductase [Burkholderiales bacterium]|nr:FAD-dependent oxidoreductase [Burkholderiales bacterium]
MNYVIIGNGPAGVIASETLRKSDPLGSILLIGDEPEPPYSRMAIPYLLMGDIQEAGTYLRKDANHFAKRNIELLVARADKVDTKNRKVLLNSGKAVSYDKLLIASGSKPISPPVAGIDLPGIYPCWTLEDARHIMKLAKKGARVLQMGAGFIGCIILEALAARGVELTVVEMGNRMVPRMMTEGAGGLIKKWCEKKGVKVFTSTKVVAIEKSGNSGNPLKVKLSNGESLNVGLVISATGVRPKIEFLEGSGIATDAGIKVDETMQTNIAGVYAAGDVAQAVEFYTGAQLVNAIQPNAADQARIAALNMAGNSTRSQGTMAINVLNTLGLISSSFGQWMGVAGGEHTELVDEENFRYMHLEFKDDMVVGATSLGLTQHVGVIRGLIQGKIRLGEWKERLLKDPTRIMEAYLARTQGSNFKSAA